MMALIALTALALYLIGLLLFAARIDRRPDWLRASRHGPLFYTLSLAVYCTSWTFFGAVGTAARSGWDYLPIYLGPILALTAFYPVWRRIAVIVKRENIGSIADFMASRYSRSRSVGIIVTVVALVSSVPYIALQLKSITLAWSIVSDTRVDGSWTSLFATLGLSAFAILLGVRRPTLTSAHGGLVAAAAVESLVKLGALILVTVLALVALATWQGNGAVNPGELGRLPRIDGTFVTLTLLASAAAFCLPRQFHLGFVEMDNLNHLRTARWLFPVYLVLTSLAIPPIVAGGLLLLGGTGIDPDIYVLALPRVAGQSVATAIAFIGGISAAAAMVTVEVVALSGMICNELIVPALLATIWRSRRQVDLSGPILRFRQVTVVVTLLLAFTYHSIVSRSYALAEIGLTSFAACAQLLPALVGGLVWRRGHWTGAVAGIVSGSVMWAVLIIVPEFGRGALVHEASGRGFDDLAITALASLAVNAALYVVISLVARERPIDRIQAAAFTGRMNPVTAAGADGRLIGTVGDAKAVVARFVGWEAANLAFRDLESRHGWHLRDGAGLDPQVAREAERILAGAIGAPTARSVIAWSLADPGRAADVDVADLLDHAAQAVHFNREVLRTALDSMAQGVSVFDHELRLVTWNAAYIALLQPLPGSLRIGAPVRDLIRGNLVNEGWPAEQLDTQVEKRFAPIRERRYLVEERNVGNARVLKTTGAPMPNGGYVISFTEVTELRRAAAELATANEQLERRVAERTAQVTEANTALERTVVDLAAAKTQAERATQAERRFVAAASHDLLQPLHAARLFMGAVGASLHQEKKAGELIGNADRAIDAADRLLRSLLNLSRLEAGHVRPAVVACRLDDLFDELWREFQPMAAASGLRMRMVRTREWVRSDPDLLRSVLQNFIGNAVRYTRRGGLIVGCRRRGDQLRIEVHDTGPGIPTEAQKVVFDEYHRLGGGRTDECGAGLGLAIAERICRLLEHPLQLQSRAGVGSIFSVEVPRSSPGAPSVPAPPRTEPMRGVRVLCVDDEPAVLKGLVALLTRWGADVTAAASFDEATGVAGEWDVALIDFHLSTGPDGLDLVHALRARCATFAITTANPTEHLSMEAARLGIPILRKPAAPGALRALLAGLTTNGNGFNQSERAPWRGAAPACG